MTQSCTHHSIDVNGISMHYVRQSAAEPEGTLLLLHGWPEFWYAWHRNIPQLAQRYDVIAPDLRGCGDSAKPAGRLRLQDHIKDAIGLLDTLGIARAGIVSHDVGAQVAQGVALALPDRISGLFFFDCPYAGIGRRWVEDGQVSEIWYQTFNQFDWAPKLVGASRDTCRLFIGHFLSHWAGDPSAFDADLELFVDNFMKPGNLAGGFAWYQAVNDLRLAQIASGPLRRPRIKVPAFCLWGECDPIIKAQWRDGIEDYFETIEVEIVADAGHFVFYEQADLTNRRIANFYSSLDAPKARR